MHRRFLLAALQQAWRGRGLCAPNPAVGAVLVHHNIIIAKAAHTEAGSLHAEQKLLTDYPAPISPDAILYITLEPCNHWGKTPPCTNLIIEKGVKHVVFAYRDINPLVQEGNTSDLLRAQGITVQCVPVPEIDAFYQSYHYWHRTGKPRVTAKIAQSLNAKIAQSDGAPCVISNLACKRRTHALRRYTDIILTTAATVLRDNPRLNVRIPHRQAKNIAILDTHLRLTGQEQVFHHASKVHVFYHDQYDIIPNFIQGVHYHPIVGHEKGLDAEAIFCTLGALGYHDVLVESGGTFFSALHEQHQVHTTYIYIAPLVLAPGAPAAYHHADWFQRPHRLNWSLEADNAVLCVTWEDSDFLEGKE